MPRKMSDVKYKTTWDKETTLENLYLAKILDQQQISKILQGKLDPNNAKIMTTIQLFISHNSPIAGIIISDTGEKLSFYKAYKLKILNFKMAKYLLQAQAATGCILDPTKNRKMEISEAAILGFLDARLEKLVTKAERSVTGYSSNLWSCYQAMQVPGKILETDHAFRLMQVQLATGGLFDPKLVLRLPDKTALDRKIISNELLKTVPDMKLFLDPTTREAISYQELIKISKTDDSGNLLLPVAKNLQNLDVSSDEETSVIEFGISSKIQNFKKDVCFSPQL